MKKLFFLLALIAVLAANYAYAITVLWDPPTSGGEVEGYTVYWVSKSNVWSETISGTTTTITLSNERFVPGVTYTFFVTAYNEYGESGPSNKVIWIKHGGHIKGGTGTIRFGTGTASK